MKKIRKWIGLFLLTSVCFITRAYAYIDLRNTDNPQEELNQIFDKIKFEKIKIKNSEIKEAINKNNYTTLSATALDIAMYDYEQFYDYKENLYFSCDDKGCDYNLFADYPHPLKTETRHVEFETYGPTFKEQSINMRSGETLDLEIINDDTDNLYLSYSNPIDYGNILKINGSKITALKKGIAAVTLKSGYITYDTIYIYVDAEEYLEEQINNLNNGIVIGALETPNTEMLEGYIRSYLNNLIPAPIMSLNDNTLVCSSLTNCNIDLTIKYNEKTYTHKGNTKITLTNSYLTIAADTVMLSIGSNVAPYFIAVKNGQDISDDLICTSSNEEIVYVQDNSCYNIIGREEGTAEVSFMYEGKKYTFNIIVGYNMGLLDKAAGTLAKTKYNFFTSDINKERTELIKKQLEKSLSDKGLEKIEVQNVIKKNNGTYQAILYYYWNKTTKTIDLDISINDLKIKENVIEIGTKQTRQIEFNGDSSGTTFKVENSKILTVSSDGLITTLSPGKTKIYVKNTLFNYSDVIEVYVDYETYLRNNIKTNYEVDSLYSLTYQIKENLEEIFEDTIFTYEIWQVEGAKDIRTIKINYITKEKQYLEINNVKMKIVYNFNSTNINLKIGETFQVKFSGSYKEWYINDPQIVSVKDGLVTGLKNGTTEIGIIDPWGDKHPIKVTVTNSETKEGLIYNTTTKKWESYKNNQIDTTFTGLKKVDTTWYYFTRGIQDTTYNGVATNEFGTWYVNNGTITRKHCEVVYYNNNWVMFLNSKLDRTYTGLGKNKSGTWYVEKGIVTKKYNGIYKDTKGKYYVITNSKVDSLFTGLKKIDTTWYYFTKGIQDNTYNGVATNEFGTWYVNNGIITRKHNEVVKYNNIWVTFINSKLDYSYTGLCSNAFGTWYAEKGIVTKKYNGTYTDKNGNIYFITNSKVDTSINGLNKINNIWYYFVKGKTNLNYIGLATNEFGTWYVEKGIITKTYNGTFKNTDGHIYTFINSKVDKNFTGLKKVNNVWYYFTKGKTNFDYTGLATNEFGTWYVIKGIVSKTYNGTYTENGKTYNVVNSKIRFN